jgi:Sulfotransferase family
MLLTKAPILVTGSVRSGTTWTGRVLGFSSDAGYVYEAFNRRLWPDWLSVRLPHIYTYICVENAHLYERSIADVLRFQYPIQNVLAAPNLHHVAHMLDQFRLSLWYRLREKRPLLKDPKGVLLAEWFAKRFDANVVVMIRHPAAFVSSIKRLDWNFDFRNWRDQPLLLRDLAGAYERRIREFSERAPDIIEQGILIWNVIHHVVDGYRQRHPEWAFIRHEDLCEDPLEGFRDLYKRLDLTWDSVVEDAIIRHSTEESRKEVPTYLASTVLRDSRAARWTWIERLTEGERDRIREGTAEVAQSFYSDEDWEPPEELR